MDDNGIIKQILLSHISSITINHGLYMNKLKGLIFSISLGLCSFYGHSAPTPIDQAKVLVNNSVILQSDIDTALKNLKLSAKGKQLPNNGILRQQVINQLILEKLQLEAADKIGIKISDSQLDQAITKIAAKNKISVSALRTKVMASGLNYPLYRAQIRQELTLKEVRQAYLRKRVSILPQEVEQLAKHLGSQAYKNVQYKLSHIELPVPEDATQEEKQAIFNKAQMIIDKIHAGEDFATLAYTYSSGPNALQGGVWDWMKPDAMPTIFAEKLNFQNKGTVIGPFVSGVGVHILKIDNVMGVKSTPIKEVKTRHILLKTTPVFNDTAAKKRLSLITQAIKNKTTTFAQMAQKYSQDPGSATKGGEGGWQISDIFVPKFKQTVDTLPEHVISQPFKSAHGWHIVEVEDRRSVTNTSKVLKDRAYQLLANRKYNEELQNWLQELKAGAYIHYVDADNNNNNGAIEK